jgi:hypothetical protein
MEIHATPQTSERDSGTGKADIGILRTKLVNIEGRLEAEESGSVAQAELIVQLTNHNAALARGVLILATVSVISSGVAIAALVLAILCSTQPMGRNQNLAKMQPYP